MGLLFLIVMVLMAIQVATKKPLCIDSSLVYKIDRISSENTGLKKESIYTCQMWKAVPFSKYFYENGDELNRRIGALELRFKPIISKARIGLVIDESNPEKWVVSGDRVEIGMGRLKSLDLETALLKSALQKQIQSHNAAFIDFLSQVLTGNSDNPSLFVELWQKTETQLGVFKKAQLHKFLLNRLQFQTEFNEISLTENILNLLELSGGKLDTLLMEPSLSIFKKNFISELQKIGLIPEEKDAKANNQSKFDIIIQAQEGVEIDLAQLINLSKKSSLRVAFQAEAQTLLLPYLNTFKAKKPSASTRILLTAKEFKNSDLKKYTKNTEHLFVLSSSKEAGGIDFSGLFDHKINRFLTKNKQYGFIKFHMPSVNSKLSELAQITDYFEFLKDKNMKNFKQSKLGWASVDWQSDVLAYKPVAIYDVIQLYRVN